MADPTPSTQSIFRTPVFYTILITALGAIGGILGNGWSTGPRGSLVQIAGVLIVAAGSFATLAAHIYAQNNMADTPMNRSVKLVWFKDNVGKILLLPFISGTFLLSGGCAGNSSVAVYQSIATDTAATEAATTLYSVGKINKAQAVSIYQSAATADAALKVWNAALNSPGGGSTTAPAAVLDALNQLLNDLQSVAPPASARRLGAARHKLATSAAISPTDVIAIIQLVTELEPIVGAWWNSVAAQPSVTQDQIAKAFADLDTSLLALQRAINPPPPAPTP